MAQLRRDNHYVPKLYLKQWIRAGKIQTYRLLVPNDNAPLWRTHSLKGIAYHQHLYTYLIGGKETDEFEQWLSREFENPAEEAIRLVVQEKRMSSEHWKILTRFAMAQDVRTPARLKDFLNRQSNTLQKIMDDTVEDSVRMLEEAARNGASPPQTTSEPSNPFPLKVTISPHSDGSGILKTETYVGRRLWLWNIRHLLTNTINKLPNYRWTILHAPTGITWPTSDNPLIRLNFWNSNQYNFGGGWGVENGDLLLPLSPKHLLYTCIGKRSWPRGTVVDEGIARTIQKIIVEHADRYVFGFDTDDIHLLRPRTVCLDTYNREQATWKNWHNEQSEAEAQLAR